MFVAFVVTMHRNRTAFAAMLILAAAHLSMACSGSDPGAGGASGSGSGGSSACPSTAPPSGDCTDPSLTCRYVDAEGCPQTIDCFKAFATPSWTRRISESGGPCTTPGQICTYSEAVGDNLPSYGGLKCGDTGKWEAHSLCPPSIPTNGETCAYPYLSCPYTGCGGTRSVSAYCNGPTDGWRIELCPDAGP